MVGRGHGGGEEAADEAEMGSGVPWCDGFVAAKEAGVVRGDLDDPASPHRGAARADAVISVSSFALKGS